MYNCRASLNVASSEQFGKKLLKDFDSCYSCNVKIKNDGFSLVEILIVTGIIALLASIAVPNLLRARVNANDAAAKAALKSISTALETYATVNSVYPTVTSSLITATPAYLNKDYFNGIHNGFTFFDTLTTFTYSVTATPISSSQGTRSFTISTGSVLTEN